MSDMPQPPCFATGIAQRGAKRLRPSGVFVFCSGHVSGSFRNWRFFQRLRLAMFRSEVRRASKTLVVVEYARETQHFREKFCSVLLRFCSCFARNRGLDGRSRINCLMPGRRAQRSDRPCAKLLRIARRVFLGFPRGKLAIVRMYTIGSRVRQGRNRPQGGAKHARSS